MCPVGPNFTITESLVVLTVKISKLIWAWKEAAYAFLIILRITF